MYLDPKFRISADIFNEARRYVERQWVMFFDFYRNCVFGFVRTAREGSGYYPLIIVHEDNELEANCNCRKHAYGRVCGHAFALFLKLKNWPIEETNLSEEFDRFRVLRFFQALPKANRPEVALLPRKALTPTGGMEHRFLAYWGLAVPENEAVRNRDRRCLEQAKEKLRSSQEKAMLKRGMGSNQLVFEESAHYHLCKYLFSIDRRTGIEVRATATADHQVDVVIHGEGRELIRWLLPVTAYRKAISKDWNLWPNQFGLRRQSLPVQYRIAFTAHNDLEIEPVIGEGIDDPIPLTALEKVGSGFFFHEALGYFALQTGLSDFELNYSDPGIHLVNHQEIKRFLKLHRTSLEKFDRALIDESLFGEVVIEHFDAFYLKLEDYRDGCFTYRLEVRLDGHRFHRDELERIFRDGDGRYRKLGGKIFDIAGYDGVFLGGLFSGETSELSVANLLRFLALFRDRLDLQTAGLARSVYKHLERLEAPSPPTLTGSQLQLRPYQTFGYRWLYFLAHFGLGGLLCDQMGLGKTHQAMALIHATLTNKPGGRVVVVAPASVLFHWRDMLKRFCPKLTAVIHMGQDRDLESAIDHYQVILSSYSTLRNDAPQCEGITFDLVLFDEIQYLKNKDTKAHKALARLSAECRVGLTGTPIENDISELKNLMDLVFPGYLGADHQFRKFLIDPIVKHGNKMAAAKLESLVQPFLLRRSKTQVLVELPEKTEDMRTLSLGDYERDIYRTVKQKGSGQIFDEAGKPVFMHVFQLIEQLKRLCNHPALYFGNTDYAAYPSNKWDTFTELMDEAIDSGEKVVIFTQFLGMIELFQNYLTAKEIHFATITGSTRDREAQQKRFMNDPNCRVFLGSIMAAGVGIDLTAASILIHYDRWWNPAREEQATDRIHRIGQKKNVQIYKFKTMDTVEERIDRIISRKRKLLDEVIGFDSESIAKSFTVGELMELLS